jgi:hypothetical protein
MVMIIRTVLHVPIFCCEARVWSIVDIFVVWNVGWRDFDIYLPLCFPIFGGDFWYTDRGPLGLSRPNFSLILNHLFEFLGISENGESSETRHHFDYFYLAYFCVLFKDIRGLQRSIGQLLSVKFSSISDNF